MSDKLRILVHLDLDCASARIEVRGHVNAASVHALYVVAKRANSMVPGLDLVLDVAQAQVEQEALQQLQDCAGAHHLPVAIDPVQADCKLHILGPDRVHSDATIMGLAA